MQFVSIYTNQTIKTDDFLACLVDEYTGEVKEDRRVLDKRVRKLWFRSSMPKAVIHTDVKVSCQQTNAESASVPSALAYVQVLDENGGVLAENYSIPSGKKNNSFLFIGDPDYARVLSENSVEVATIENNHIDDFGAQGRSDTQSAIEAVGVQWADEYHPTVYVVKDVRIAVLAYKTFDYYNTLFTKVPAEVEAAKEKNDIVICCFHWGKEKDYAPNDNQQKLGRMAIDAGADLVVGHHSHRINPIEQYNGKYIVYSLGNFSFAGNKKPDDMSTFIFQTRFRIKDGEITANPFRIIPCRISSKTDRNDFIPTVFAEELRINNVINVMQKNGAKLPYAVTEYPLDWE